MQAMERYLAGCAALRSDDPDPELIEATRAFVSELHELANIDAAKDALVATATLPPAGASWVAVTFGSAVEGGRDPHGSCGPLVDLLRVWLGKLPQPASNEDEAPARLDEAQQEIVNAMPWLCQSVVTHLARMDEYRGELAGDEAILARLDEAEEYTYAATWVRELLNRLSGSLLALHPESVRALQLEYENIGNCFHLFTLMQAAIGTTLPDGREPDPLLVDAAQGDEQNQVSDQAWWHYGTPHCSEPDFIGSIWGEASVASIPVIDQTQVMVLWPSLLSRRSWDADFFGPPLEAARPHVRVVRELPAAEAAGWFERLGIEKTLAPPHDSR